MAITIAGALVALSKFQSGSAPSQNSLWEDDGVEMIATGNTTPPTENTATGMWEDAGVEFFTPGPSLGDYKMTKVYQENVPVRNEALSARITFYNATQIEIYSGTIIATPDDPITDQVKLAVLEFDSPAFADPVNAVSEANPITPGVGLAAAGIGTTATWFRVVDGVDVISIGSVGVSGCDLNMNSTTIVFGNTVSIASLQLRQNAVVS